MADSDKNIRITTNKNKPTVFPNIVFTGSSAGTSVLTLEVRDDNTVAFTGADGDVFSLDYNLSTGTIWSVNDKSGTPLLRASAGGTIGIAELGSGVIVGIGQTNPKYKLDVQGWVGFASTGDGSYTVLLENGLATGNNALSIRAANALRFYNSGNTLYTGFIGAQSGVNTTYTLPATSPATGTSVLQSTSGGLLSWVPMVAGSSSGTVNSGSANFAAYYATASTAVSENANLQFTGSGVSVGGNLQSTSTTTGSLQVRGGFAITGNAFIGGTINVPSTSVSNISNMLFANAVVTSGSWAGSAITGFYGGTGYNSYTTGDILVGAGNTFIKLNSGLTNYVLTSTGTGSVPSWQAVPASSATSVAATASTSNASFFITTVNTSSGTGLGLSTVTSFVVNPSTGLVTLSGLAVTNLANSSSTTTGALTVSGGIGVTGNAFIGGTTNITSSQVSISPASGALVVTGGVGIGGSLFTGSGSSSSISGVILANGNVSATTYNKLTLSAPASAATLTLANNSTLATSGANSLTLTTTAASNVTFPTAGTLTTTGNDLSVFASTTSAQLATLVSDETGTAGKLVFSTSPTFTTSVVTDSASFGVFNTNATTVNAFQAGTAISLGASTGTLTLNNAITLHNQTTATTSTTTGAIVVSGGVGIGLSVSVGGRLQLFNGATNYTAFVSSATGATTYTLPPRTPTGTGTSFLSSGIDGVMAWVAAPTSGGGSPGGSSGQIQYNNGGSAFGGVSGLTYSDPGSGLVFVVNTPASSGAGLFGVLNVGPSPFDGLSIGQFAGSILGTFIAVNAGTGFTGNFVDFQIRGVSGFAVSSNGKVTIGNNVWSLPTTSGTSGQVLTSGGNGAQATWTTVTGSSSTGGTVFAGTVNQIAFYGATGNTVGGSSTFTNNPTSGVVNITHTTPSSSTSTGALVVSGSVGVGGSLFVGGQINQTYVPTSGAAIDHAVFIQSNPVATTVGSLIQIGSANKWDGTTAGFFTGSFNGTYLGINTGAGNTADFLNFQQNGQPVFKVGVGGTNFQIGSPISYSANDVLASFASSATNYNQVILQNLSKSTSASADFVISNDVGTDTTFYGNFGINSSTFTGTGALAAANAVYVTATSGPLVFGTTTAHPIRFVVNGGTSDMLYFSESGTAISCFVNFGMRNASDLRFWNSGNTFYAAIQGGGNSANYTLTLPTAPVGAGSSLIVVGSDSNMYFVAPGAGIAFSASTANTPTIRAKRALTLQFAAGYTPLAAGPDNVILKIPQAVDGVSLSTFQLRELDIRVETPSAGQSRIQLEKYTGTTAFTLGGGLGLSMVAGFGITLTGAGTYTTSTSFAAGVLTTSNDKLRLNWTLLNATHANFTVQLTMEEV